MTEQQAKRAFNKYNPVEKKTRCPNGYAPIRSLLDRYAKAATNLYGIIKVKEFVNIFNSQNPDLPYISEEAFFDLILPVILKHNKPFYCFYEDFIVHYFLIDDFDVVALWEEEQKRHTDRFIPGKEEFLKFESIYYESPIQRKAWDAFYEFASKEWPDRFKGLRMFNELHNLVPFDFSPNIFSETIDKYSLEFKDEESLKSFLTLFSNVINNTRMWSNKGYTPFEIVSSESKKEPEKIFVNQSKPLRPNQPCHCGSGLRYSECCLPIETSSKSRLSPSEKQLFYKIWLKLLYFVNQKKHVVTEKISTDYRVKQDDKILVEVRNVLWDNPDLIGDFIRQTPSLTPVEKALLSSWKKHHVNDKFFVIRHELEHSLFMCNPENSRGGAVYAVKGMSSSIPEILHMPLPIMVYAVLLPFGSKIVYDTYLQSVPLKPTSSMKKAIEEEAQELLDKNGLVKNLYPIKK